jgi:hypothetical protein
MQSVLAKHQDTNNIQSAGAPERPVQLRKLDGVVGGHTCAPVPYAVLG